MADLTMESRQVEGVVIVCPRGFINAHTVRQFEQELNSALESGHFKIIINGSGLAYVASAEDTILTKLEWYRMGGESSDRQWNDVLNVIKVQGEQLDRDYLMHWARQLGVADLLELVLDQARLA